MIIEEAASYTFEEKEVCGAYFMGNFMRNGDFGGNKGFLYIMAREKEYESFPRYLKFGRKKEKRRQQYLKKKLPVETEVWEILGQEGLRVRLPFTCGELKTMEEAVLKDFLERIRKHYGGSGITAEDRLLSFFPKEAVCSGRVIPLFFIGKIIHHILETKKMPKKEARLVLFDGGSPFCPYLLRLLGEQYNYLTFVTEEPDSACEEVMEQLLEEYGLVVSTDRGNEGEISGDIFIDVTEAAKSCCRRLPEGCVLIDLLGNHDRRYMESRLRKGTLFQSFRIGKWEDGRKEQYPLQLIEAVCFGDKGKNPDFFLENFQECYERLANLEKFSGHILTFWGL